MPVRPMGEQQPDRRARAGGVAQAVVEGALHPAHTGREQLRRGDRRRGGRGAGRQSCQEAARAAQGHPHLPHQVKSTAKGN